jgi:hypothetical protein
MSRIIAILIANFFVVDYGIAPDGNGNSVYVIQIEPEVAKQLVAGYAIESVIPPELRGVRKFRIQIGDEKLIKPTPLLPALEGQEGALGFTPAPVTTNGDEKSNEVSEGESTGIDPRDLPLPLEPTERGAKPADDDAFPLLPEPKKSLPTADTGLIPEPVDASDLPGNPEGFVKDDINVREVFEPDATTLPHLLKTPVVVHGSDEELEPTEIVEQSDAESVLVPVFDKLGSVAVIEVPADAEQTAHPFLDLLGNTDEEKRVVLGDSPSLDIAADESAVAAGTADNEPMVWEDDASKFVRLATATSIGEDVPSLKPSIKGTNTLSPESRSWPLFSITLLGLLVSVGGNVYLGMTVVGFYRKGQGTLSDLAKPIDADSE